MIFVSTASSHCNGNPCQNGGKCTDTGDNFHCDCQNGFTGAICQIGKAYAAVLTQDLSTVCFFLVYRIILWPCFSITGGVLSLVFLSLGKQSNHPWKNEFITS